MVVKKERKLFHLWNLEMDFVAQHWKHRSKYFEKHQEKFENGIYYNLVKPNPDVNSAYVWILTYAEMHFIENGP